MAEVRGRAKIVNANGTGYFLEMKPRVKLATSKTPDGVTMALFEHDEMFSAHGNRQELMHSQANASEKMLGQLDVAQLGSGVAARVLIGGFGFTLQRVLESVGPETKVEVNSGSG